MGAIMFTASPLQTACVVAAVVLAAISLWRAPWMPIAGRQIVACLAAYAVAALLVGVVANSPFPSRVGADVWGRTLPLVLGGAFLVSLCVLPLALVGALSAAGLRHPRSGSRRRACFEAVAFAVALAILAAAVRVPYTAHERASVGNESAAAVRYSVPPTTPQSVAGVEGSLRAIEDGERESPRDRWDPNFVVNQLDADPERIVAWVRDNTSWVPYHGMLRGPVGVLMDRLGNSLDRAVLLATLLRIAGQSVRVAHSDLTGPQTRKRLASILAIAPPPTVTPPPLPDKLLRSSTIDLAGAAVAYGLDHPGLGTTLARQLAAVDGAATLLRSRVADQTKRLSAVLKSTDANAEWQERLGRTVDAIRDHWWVQRNDGKGWVDVEVDRVSPQFGSVDVPVADEIVALDDVGRLSHEIVVRVIVERWAAGTLHEQTALAGTIRPFEVFEKPVTLQLWPVGWPAEFPPPGSDPHEALTSLPLDQHEWAAVLTTGGDVVESVTITDGGKVTDLKATESATAIRDRLADRLRGRSELPENDGAVLTAARIEYEIRSFGQKSRTVRRALFDLVDADARAAKPVPAVTIDRGRALLRSLSLMMTTEILPVASRPAPEFVMHLAAQGVLNNGDLLRSAVRGTLDEQFRTPLDVARRLAPMPSPLHTLALARFEWSRVGDQVYVDRPGILTRHLFFTPRGKFVALRDVTDIVANEVGVHVFAADAPAVRLEQGVVDTNAESLVRLGVNTAGNTGDAFASPGEWITFPPRAHAQLQASKLSNDVRQRIAAELEAGFVVVAPADGDVVGWWRIDPRTGDAIGLGENGWGASLVEYAALAGWAFVAAFLFDYLWCSGGGYNGMTGGSNKSAALRPADDRHQFATLWLPELMPPLEAAAGSECFQSSLLAGLLGAVASLVPVTWPLLLKFVAGRWGPNAAKPLGWWGGEGNGFGNGGGETGGPAKGGGGTTGGGKTGGGTDPLAKTQPDPLGKTEVDPMARTEPAPGQAPDRPKPPAGPVPSNPTREDLKNAAEAAAAAQDEHLKATSKYLQYFTNKQVFNDPSWDPEVNEALKKAAYAAGSASEQANQRWSATIEAAKASAKSGAGRPGPQPNPAKNTQDLGKTQPDMGDTLPGAPCPSPPCASGNAKSAGGIFNLFNVFIPK